MSTPYPTIKQLRDFINNLPAKYDEYKVAIILECNDIVKNSYEQGGCEIFALGDPKNKNYLVVKE